jgi:ribose transport system substrate-binding protein
MLSRLGRIALYAVLALALALFVAACGDDDDSGGTSTADAAGEQAGGDDGVAAAKQTLAALYTGETFKEPPQDSPKPEAGKNVWVIPFGLEAPEGADWSKAAKRAGEVMGWDVTSFDGKFSPDEYLQGIRQAIADKADAIALYVIDCAPVRAGLQQAREAGIKIVAAQGADCDQTKEGSEPLFDGSVDYTQGDFEEWGRALGAAQADWIIAKTDGKAKAIELWETDTFITNAMHEGYVAEMGTCSGCEIVGTVEFLATDFGPKLQEKAEQALLKQPDANAVAVPYDGVMTAGVAPAIKSSGRSDQLFVIAGVGLEANIELIRSGGGQDAGYGVSVRWEGYAAMDAVNRLLNGEEPANSGNGIGMFDAENGLPDSGQWEPPIDFAAGYEKAWRAALEE